MEACANCLREQAIGCGPGGAISLAATVAGAITAPFVRGMAVGADFTAESLTVFGDTVCVRNGAFAIRARTWSCRWVRHNANI